MKKLKDTVHLMNSDDHRDRFKAEYMQLTIRIERLAALLDKWEHGALKFKPQCSRRLLARQLRIMERYARVLEARADAEGIAL